MLELFVRAISHVLIPMFLIGMGGSAVVVAITVVHDIHDFFADNGEEKTSPDGLS